MQENKINFSLSIKPNKRRSILKRNKNKKRSLLYCTLAICLIAGVWKINSLTSSKSYSLSSTDYIKSYQKPNKSIAKASGAAPARFPNEPTPIIIAARLAKIFGS